ncbi:MAG: RuBisCO accumulation factor 1 [Leptolyngbya sp. BL-A-14]
MTDTPQNFSQPQPQSDVDGEGLLKALRRKEGSWVEWGQACQTLQKAGYSQQAIFEATGFEPIQQNQIIVGGQVYASAVSEGVPDAVRTHFERKGSDLLYEFRILTQAERAAAAILAVEKNIDADEARDVAKAIKDFSRLGASPEGFTDHPGDAIAYQSWKLAHQKADLQERSRLIARGLRFVHSDDARKQIERLLTDFSVVRTVPAPSLPVYRLETDEDLPRVIPVVGKLPLTKADLQAVPMIETIEPFGMVKFEGAAAWVPVPGWQIILTATDPVVLLCDSHQDLPTPLSGKPQEVLVVVDRAQRTWRNDRYFITEEANQLQIKWSDVEPETSLLGEVILVMRPKKIVDESYTKDYFGSRPGYEGWQTDE